ncbi:hypothetical protein T492DRAFT_951127 [Pavlovales sp. CCMP2436]|nr:hypothetical protein T492DRAFT_951127 [Pavlovales sp. CCMP2436]
MSTSHSMQRRASADAECISNAITGRSHRPSLRAQSSENVLASPLTLEGGYSKSPQGSPAGRLSTRVGCGTLAILAILLLIVFASVGAWIGMIGAHPHQAALEVFHHAVHVLRVERHSVLSRLETSSSPTDEHAQLLALQAELRALKQRVEISSPAAKPADLELDRLRTLMAAEELAKSIYVTDLEAELRTRAERERRSKLRMEVLEARTIDAERREREGADKVKEASDSVARAEQRAERLSRAHEDEMAKAAEAQAAAAAATAATAAAEPQASASDFESGAEFYASSVEKGVPVTLTIFFPPSQLLGKVASLYWVSESGSLEQWYNDLAQGRSLLQKTVSGERWRLRDAKSGNHLLSVNVPAANITVQIEPASAVTLELHYADVRRTRLIAPSASPDGAALPVEGEVLTATTTKPRIEDDTVGELRVFKAAAVSEDQFGAGRLIGIGDKQVGRLAPDGQLHVQLTPGDVLMTADATGRVCFETIATHELHQHVNVFCAPLGEELPATTRKGTHVRVEFVLDGIASGPAALFRLWEAPRAWHKHAEVSPREALAVLTEPGERWRVRDVASGRVLTDVIVSAQAFQRVVVRDLGGGGVAPSIAGVPAAGANKRAGQPLADAASPQ